MCSYFWYIYFSFYVRWFCKRAHSVENWLLVGHNRCCTGDIVHKQYPNNAKGAFLLRRIIKMTVSEWPFRRFQWTPMQSSGSIKWYDLCGFLLTRLTRNDSTIYNYWSRRKLMCLFQTMSVMLMRSTTHTEWKISARKWRDDFSKCAILSRKSCIFPRICCLLLRKPNCEQLNRKSLSSNEFIFLICRDLSRWLWSEKFDADLIASLLSQMRWFGFDCRSS